MNLWERNLDAFFHEFVVNILSNVSPNSPIVFDGSPKPERKIHGTFSELADGNFGSIRLLLDKRVAIDDVPKNSLSFV